jgi:hypothetical protein
MSSKNSRDIIRWIHLILGFAMGVYIYSPWSKIQTIGLLTKFILFPVVTISGLWLWLGPQLLKILRKSK